MKLEIRRLRSLSLTCNELRRLGQVTCLSVTHMRAYVISKISLYENLGPCWKNRGENGRRKLHESRNIWLELFSSLDMRSSNMLSDGLGRGFYVISHPLNEHRGSNDLQAEESFLCRLIARVRWYKRKNQELNSVSSNCCSQSGDRFFP